MFGYILLNLVVRTVPIWQYFIQKRFCFDATFHYLLSTVLVQDHMLAHDRETDSC